MAGFLAEGKWKKEDEFANKEGKFVRFKSSFRDIIKEGNSSGYIPEANRYHLYVSYACPWAHRTLIMRRLKGLEKLISISVVHPYMGDNGWTFADYPGTIADNINNSEFLYQIYTKAKSDFSGKVTVPVLWDKKTNTIVNNESREIMRIFDIGFDKLAEIKKTYYPEELREKIDNVIDRVYEPINNGVYKTGFAAKQKHYQENVSVLFDALEYWDNLLENQRYLCGDIFTEADICMFTTLFRFDPVYYLHFKCNLKRIIDYPNLWNYLKDIYQIEGIKETCNLDHIKKHYYQSHININPKQIVPLGPILNYEEGHNRDRFA